MVVLVSVVSLQFFSSHNWCSIMGTSGLERWIWSFIRWRMIFLTRQTCLSFINHSLFVTLLRISFLIASSSCLGLLFKSESCSTRSFRRNDFVSFVVKHGNWIFNFCWQYETPTFTRKNNKQPVARVSFALTYSCALRSWVIRYYFFLRPAINFELPKVVVCLCGCACVCCEFFFSVFFYGHWSAWKSKQFVSSKCLNCRCQRSASAS